MGRPSKYKEEYCEMLIDHMERGLSYESFAAKLRVTRDCLYKWEKMHPNFLYAKKTGKELMLLFFEELGIQAMAGKIKNFPNSTYIFTVKNKCGWKDTIENEIKSEGIKINFSKAEK